MSDLKPALTPDEWATDCESAISHAAEHVEWSLPPTFTDHKGDAVHALAALALHGQPFGFTREDVVNLRSHAIDASHRSGWSAPEEHWAWLIADRIAALLPPESP